MTDDESVLLPWPPCPRPGWTELYGRMIEQLRAVDPDISPQLDGVYVGEGLTVLVRTTAGHDSVWPILCRAAETSLRTCEQCGQPGEWQEWIDGNPVLCAEHTPEIRTGPVATVGELVERLRHLPASTPLLTDGYEGGLTTISAVAIIEVQQLDRDEDQGTYLGEFETVDEARRQASLSPADPELAIGGIRPPTLVGDSIRAVVLRRKGR